MDEKQSLFRGAVRRDSPQGRPRQIRGEFAVPERETPEESVREFLSAHQDELSLDARSESLRSVRNISTPTGYVVRFEQLVDEIPVFGSEVIVELDRENRIRRIDLEHKSAMQILAPEAGATRLSSEQAVDAALNDLGNPTLREAQPEARTTEVYYPKENRLRRAYLVRISTLDPPHDWQIVVDTHSGEILEKDDLLMKMPDGEGLVFDPNPVVTAENNQLTLANLALLDAQRVVRALKDLTFSGGVYRLEGPHVKIHNFQTPNYSPPTETDPKGFKYSSSQQEFEAVMVYYHVDNIQRYIQSLGITNAHETQIKADPQDDTFSNAWFSPFDKGLHFCQSNDGLPARATDAEVILHEYGHAILADQVLNWGAWKNPVTGRHEARAMGEGFGDILACVYFAPDHSFQPEVFEDWIFHAQDGLRRVDGNKVYPRDWIAGDNHANGEIWSAALWTIYLTIGGGAADLQLRRAARDALLKSLILSHQTLPIGASMPDWAEAVMSKHGELDGYRGRYLPQMLDSFHDRGVLRVDDDADSEFESSDNLWIRNDDDGGDIHQTPAAGQENWLHARVLNQGTMETRAFVVSFHLDPTPATPPAQVAERGGLISAAVGFDLAAGGTTTLKASWPADLIPSGYGPVTVSAQIHLPHELPPPAGQSSPRVCSRVVS